VIVSNSNPKERDRLTLAVSKDGLVFDRLFYDFGGLHVDCPHMIEHAGYLYAADLARKQSVEIRRVRIADLDTVKMPARR